MNKIKRYNLLGVLAVLMVSLLASCNNDAPDQPDRLPIEIEASVNGVKSRVINDGNGSILDFSEGDTIRVDLWSLPSGASSTTDDPDLMRKQLMTYTGSEWDYSPKQYWSNTSGDRLVIFAYYLDGAPNCVVKEDWDSSSGYPTIEFSGYNFDSDVLVAPVRFLAKSDLENGKIKLDFRHIMTRLKMEVRYWDDEEQPNDRNSIFLEKVTYWNCVNKGTFIGFDSTGTPKWENIEYTTGGWSISNSQNGYVIPWGETYMPLEGFTQYHYPFVGRHADADNPYEGKNSKFGFDIKNSEDDTSKKYIERWFDGTFEAGKSYTFKVTLKLNNDIVLDIEEDKNNNWWSESSSIVETF